MTRETLWAELGLNEPIRVLIIEDHRAFAAGLEQILTNEGHSVTRFAGVHSCDQKTLLGIDPNLEVELKEYDVCFLDHYFEGGFFTGSTIAPFLTKAGINICGMSSVDSANRAMLAQGASVAILKSRLENLL